MSTRISVLVMGLVLHGGPYAWAQESNDSGSPPAALPTPSMARDLAQIGQATNDLWKASASLERFGQSLEKVAPLVAETTVATSQSMAAMSEGFDPFGFKSAFRVIHEQNLVIQQQNEIIRQMQRDEIRRLQQELEQLRKN